MMVRMTDSKARMVACQESLFNRVVCLCGQMPLLAEAVKRGFGPYLYEMAKEGRLTADVVRQCADGGGMINPSLSRPMLRQACAVLGRNDNIIPLITDRDIDAVVKVRETDVARTSGQALVESVINAAEAFAVAGEADAAYALTAMMAFARTSG